tara:strand:+ start:162 stop:296 length:135 start_codon:yes stop_codon:yes gene_type:complete
MNYSSIGIFYGGCNNAKRKKTLKIKKKPKKSMKKYKTIKFSKFL